MRATASSSNRLGFVYRQPQFGGDEPLGRGGDVELRERGVVLGGDQMGLCREQLLPDDEHVEDRAGCRRATLPRSQEEAGYTRCRQNWPGTAISRGVPLTMVR